MTTDKGIANDNPTIEPDPHNIAWDASQGCPGCGGFLTTIERGKLWVHYE